MTVAALSRRIERLEHDLGAPEDLHFVVAFVQPGETKEEALRQAVRETGLTRDQVGRVVYFIPYGEESFLQKI